MSDKYSLAFDALSDCETVIRRFELFAVKQRGGHILEDTGFYDRQIVTQGNELAAAIARLRGPLAAVESEIAAFWPLLDEADRNASQTGALRGADPFRKGDLALDQFKDAFGRFSIYQYMTAFNAQETARRRNAPAAPTPPGALDGIMLRRATDKRHKETRFTQSGQYSVEVFTNKREVYDRHEERVGELKTWLEATRAYLRSAQSWTLWANLRIDDQKQVKGQTVVTVKIGDNNTFNAPVAIAETIKDSLKHINTSNADDALKTALQELIRTIGEAGEDLPTDKAEDLAIEGEAVARELARETPRKEKLRDQINGLAATAQALGKAALPILDAVGKGRALIGL